MRKSPDFHGLHRAAFQSNTTEMGAKISTIKYAWKAKNRATPGGESRWSARTSRRGFHPFSPTTRGPALLWLMILALGLTTAGCTGSKSLAKKGAKLEEAGLYDNAALFYYNSLLRNSNNVDARIGLARTGQRVVNDKL